MDYKVRFTSGARKDLRSIFDDISENDSAEKTHYVIEQIVEVALALRKLRQVFIKPYRILYTVRGTSVVIAIIADGRRDMQFLLANRLFGNR